MITIQLTGNENDVQKAAFVMQQLFEITQETVISRGDGGTQLQLIAQNLPDNKALLALLKIAEWQTAMNEIWKLADQPIVRRDQLQRLRESIEAAANLASDFDDLEASTSKEASEALSEIERIEGAAVGYILNAAHPALPSEYLSTQD